MKENYHHGNLKNDLIDMGIKIINSEGEKALSLRKVAAACGVSHSAPYAHFNDKEELLEAMNDTVTNLFINKLYEAVNSVQDQSAEKKIVAMGKGYVQFFIDHPDYYSFLFYNQKITVHLAVGENHQEDYPPFLLLKELYDKYLEEKEIEQRIEEKEIALIKIWSTVQGLASLVCMENVTISGTWEEYLEYLID